MTNWDIQAAWQYHEGTKHPGGSLMDPWHRYHPSRQPLLFKRYLDLEPIPLDLDPSSAGTSALDAISRTVAPDSEPHIPDLTTLARLLYYSAGITKRIEYPGWGAATGAGSYVEYFRAAACTGALYHIELYAVCQDLEGLPAGVYHFDPADFALRQLRAGDYRPVLCQASGTAAELSTTPLMLVYTDMFGRNAVKYQAREYRHAFWDSGTILSHSLAVSAAHHLPARLVMGFVDEAVNSLLGLDPDYEAALAILGVGSSPSPIPPAPEMRILSYPIMPIAEQERVFPAILEVHRSSSLVEPQQVIDWRKWAGTVEGMPVPGANTVPLERIPLTALPGTALEQVIVRRGSTRRYARRSISYGQLSTILERMAAGFPADFLIPGTSLIHTFLIAHAVDGLEPGAYQYLSSAGRLLRIKQGDYRLQARHLALDQDLARDASANLYFLTDLQLVLERFGNRGYRAAQMEAAITAGRVYLAAYGQGFGASGLTFNDDEVIDFFSPQAEGLKVMFLMTVGWKARKV
jgi:SagB-type dehydrogenase family enzyme